MELSIDFEIARQMALSLDNVEESTSYGTPAFKVKGKLFARLHQDGESLVIRMDVDQREDFINIDPDTYFITDHYKDYPWLLIRMSRVKPDALRKLLTISWNLAKSEKKRSTKSSKG
jgi:hypothetical protein